MIEITLDTAQVRLALEKLQRATGNLEPVFNDIGEHLINTTRQRFETKKTPDGTDWKENRPSTQKRKGGDNPLIGETRELSTSISKDVRPTVLQVGSALEYAAMQQFGGTKDEFPNLWGDIPARPFLGLSDDDEKEVLALVMDHLQRAAGV
jgi:phage virion morphogenesis protein